MYVHTRVDMGAPSAYPSPLLPAMYLSLLLFLHPVESLTGIDLGAGASSHPIPWDLDPFPERHRQEACKPRPLSRRAPLL
jgi:hypothetical protein